MSAQDDVKSLVRVAGGAYLRTAEWAIRGALGAIGMRSPHDPPQQSTAQTPAPTAAQTTDERRRQSLRDRGEELLRRSADVREDDDSHPAYARILDELLPDEARILRLLNDHGPQAAVDVRAGAVPLNATTELIAPGLSMIGAEAGCRRPERVHAYLNNLSRLGLVWFSREPVPGQSPYQVLEAQPEVIEALRAKGRSRTVRRSIHLTPFGEDFCLQVLPPPPPEAAPPPSPT